MEHHSAAAIRVVAIDDDELYRDYIRTVLRDTDNFDVSYAVDGASSLALLDMAGADCVILDYDLGVENGIAIAQTIKRKYSDPPPIVMLSGKATAKVITMALREGFSDFLIKKTLTPNELIGAVSNAVDRRLKEKAQELARMQLARMSSINGITGLYTGDFIKARSRELVASAIRRGESCAAIIVRPHDLESVVDTFGFVVRDRALRMFASRLRGAVSKADICGHYAEDSFLYLIDRESTLQTITDVCERLSRDLTFALNVDQASFNITVRIGAALFPEAAATVELFLEAADRALSYAQSNRVPFTIAPPIYAESGCVEISSPLENHPVAADLNPSELGQLTVNRSNDRRKDLRHRVLKRGKICLHGLESVLDCTIRDMSNNGARLRLPSYYLLPDRFELLIIDSGLRRPVAVRWRAGLEFGVQYIPL